MKALVLAAGFGKRLKPYTDKIPKPLFPLEERPVLERTINQLISSGCEAVIINTHHLHDHIERFVADRYFSIPVVLRHEPVILETGGAIKNTRDFFDDRPFIVVNGDIVTDIDYKEVYRFHKSHDAPVTLVLHDFPEFNNVTVNKNDDVTGFHLEKKYDDSDRILAFTGIQVIDPRVIDFIGDGPSSSIDLYRTLISENITVRAMVLEDIYWQDMGTPLKYADVCRDFTAPSVFRMVFNKKSNDPVSFTHLAGDGSDRRFFRVSQNDNTMIMADHGITLGEKVCEAISYEKIGRHLVNRRIPVPKIYWSDRFVGHVYVEDLGDTSLEASVKSGNRDIIRTLYHDALKNLALMSVKGLKGFSSKWTFQTEKYDRNVIIERECRYFTDAFVKGYLGADIDTSLLDSEFSELADCALKYGCEGFMHRDFQSRNILVKNNRCYFIDFQSGRIGPVQYDLASILIDPYTALERDFQDELTDFFIDQYSRLKQVDRAEFLEGYKYLKITRNLQMLGAFGFLSTVKKKKWFEEYIPQGLSSLRSNLSDTDDIQFENIKKIVDKISGLG